MRGEICGLSPSSVQAQFHPSPCPLKFRAMPPQSFDRSKTDLKSLLRSGTWLYQCGQGAGSFPSSPNLSAPSFNVNDLYNDSDRDIHNDTDLNTDGRPLDQIDLRDLNSADFPLNTFNFEPPEHQDDRTIQDGAQDYALGQSLSPSDQQLSIPLATDKDPSFPKNGESGSGLLTRSVGSGKWGWLLLALGLLIPVGLFKGISGLDPLPQSASSLSPSLSPGIELEGKTAAVGPLERAAQEAERATALVSTARTPADWQTVVMIWQDAITLLGGIPTIDPQYAVAQNRMVSYQSQLDYATAQRKALAMASKVLEEQDQIFRSAVSVAMEASALTQTARTPQEWQRVATMWQSAIDGMSQISVQSPHYAIAQDRISTYTNNLNYAQRNAHSKV
jgi:hypothetical protein